MLGALLFSVFSSSHLALQVPEPKKADALVMNARALLDTPYVFGGRLGVGRQKEGIDCQGTLFYALEKTYEGCDWRSYSVMPTTTISHKELGAIHLAPVLTKDLRLDRLAPGDFIFMLGWAENPAEEAIATLKGRKVWVWHTALYSGEGRMIVGDHFAGKVIETDLLSYLKEHEDISMWAS